MADVLLKSFTFIFIIALGYTLKRIGFFKKEDYKLIEKIVIHVTLPATIIYAFADFERKASMFAIVGLGLVCSLIPLLLAFALSFRDEKKRRAYKMFTSAGFNIGCFTLPIVQAFFGSAGIVPACMFDTGNAIIVTGGSYALTSSVLKTNPDEKLTLWSFVRKFLTSVPFDTYMLMLTMAALGLPMPDAVNSIAGSISSANSFLAMLMFGMIFELRLDAESLKSVSFVLVIRYTMAVICSFCLYRFTPFSLTIRQVLSITAFAPASALAPIYTGKCGGDPALSSFTGSITIVLSFLSMTCLALLMGV